MTNAEPSARILVVDDERPLLTALVTALESMGYEVVGELKQSDGLSLISSWQPDAAIFDLNMPGMNGVELAARALEIMPDLPVILLTGFGTIDSAVQAMRAGVFDYLTKPFDLNIVDLTLKKALDHHEQKRRFRVLAEATGRAGEFSGIVGKSQAIRKVLDAVQVVADTDSTVLVTGESGTGKEVIAHAIHVAGSRREKPFITVDCAAIPDTLIESELFGHARGAFTGAHKDRAGHIEAAADGTVFLDEIGEIPLGIQKKLLRVLEEKTFVRVGETRRRLSQARIVAATNRDLAREVQAGRFREDLYYRLKVIEICIPPLRDRAEDIPLLVEWYLTRLNRKLNRKISGISPSAMKLLSNYQWPGNVRELVNLLEQVMTFHNPDILDVKHLPNSLQALTTSLPSQTFSELKDQVLEEVGRSYFQSLLNHFQGNVTKVADYAGINRRHIHRLLHIWGINPASFRNS
ncbi:sigma-54-dependent transcriptional regulator [Geobacter argillaceus]|uniref:Two-component system nitrogen regulation response regulator NtrX n=1 Tax=Geobacter argillaceus TaxID=345631 RepID=A0A562VLF3_9BACT|nr:sigma-54 dependent transcriptional regulator [Geobacter argillaceus]TWJ18720.1 two-component system nitrogen regulation response regulator NtrX [Geobacter argillaceus]